MAITKLVCSKCKLKMAQGKVTVLYLGQQFSYQLPRCPGCGMAYVPEDLATGKMAQVEQALEDK